MKILQVEADLSPVKEQTYRMTDKCDLKLIMALGSFLNALTYENICMGSMAKVPIFEENVRLNDWVIQT